MDLGSNFHSHQFWEFCERSAIEAKYVSVAHPWANGQVEHANGLILDGLKQRLYDEQKEQQVDQWDLVSSLGTSHTTEQSHRIVTFISCLWV
jgi:IS30 family transposase